MLVSEGTGVPEPERAAGLPRLRDEFGRVARPTAEGMRHQGKAGRTGPPKSLDTNTPAGVEDEWGQAIRMARGGGE